MNGTVNDDGQNDDQTQDQMGQKHELIEVVLVGFTSHPL